MADVCCGPDEAASSAERAEHDEHEAPSRIWQVRELQLAGLSGLLLVTAWLVPGDTATTVLEWAAVVLGGATFVPGAVRGLLRGRLGVALLMTIAAAGALVLGQVGEAATLAFLFSIAEGLEEYAVARTRHGLRALLDLAPARATVVRDGGQVEVPVEELQVGDRLVVRPGEKVATDGVVESGRSWIDTAVVTGESVPAEVQAGSLVYAGTVNGSGPLTVQVIATAKDNSLARMVHVVEEAQERKGSSQRLAERFARPLVPGVLILAALVALLGSVFGDPSVWIPRALVVLVAAAPCAFALAVPVAVVAAIGAASKAGVLVKGGAAVEELGRIDVVAVDKTGTLTRNEPTVVATVTVPGVAPARVLDVAAALEALSEHPLAAPIMAAAEVRQERATDVQAVPGRGLTGTVSGASARLGKPGFIEPGDLAHRVDDLQSAGATVVLVELDGRLLGAIAVRDEIRPEAAEAVRMLKHRGISVVMLTGDNARTAAAIAADAGIDEVRAELLPEDKARIVTELQARGRVAMVGDGINDAPALATADAGVAMGVMGSDVAIEAADVALMGEDLRRLADSLAHAAAARRILMQNLVLSGAIILALVPLAAFGVLGLAAVVATHELAEVLVIANGIRAGRRRLMPARPALGTTRAAAVARPSGSVATAPARPSRPFVTVGERATAGTIALPLGRVVPHNLTSDQVATDGCGCEPGCDCCP